jgi:hypothetical protein
LRALNESLKEDLQQLKSLQNGHAPQSVIAEWQRTIDLKSQEVHGVELEMAASGCLPVHPQG